jgi:signal transduction histidine kinase
MTNSDLLSQVASLQSQLERLQGLATVGELTATTTHEFNNILTTILNYAKLGLRQRDDASREKALQKILDAATRAAKISQTVLSSVRNRSGDFEPTDLAAVIRDSLVLLERELQKYRIALQTQIDDIPKVWADGNQLQQLLINLLINSRQAMPQGGSLSIRLQQEGVGPAASAVLTIQDTGCGIPADVLPRIFDPQFTTKRSADESGLGGTGLGLATCRKIIERHRGKIRVESTVGKGTAMIIRIPLAPSIAQAS